VFLQTFPTTAGWVAAAWSEKGLAAFILPRKSRAEALGELKQGLIRWGCGENDDQHSLDGPSHFSALLQRLAIDYFQGLTVNFDIPVDLSWCTLFQKEVLNSIRLVPYGETCSYGHIAARSGFPRAARAVGRVAGLNRTPIVIPCHRIIRQNGKPGGFSGPPGMKNYLLALEKKISFFTGSSII
jgi:methylated-DNA-[protein]-cysteine S-methyltransferase